MGCDCQIFKSTALAARDCSHLKSVAWLVEALSRLLSACLLEPLDGSKLPGLSVAFAEKGRLPSALSSPCAIAPAESLMTEITETSGVA